MRLSIFRWIAEAIPVGDRWYPVFQRYLKLIAIRVSELGGDPTKITPGRIPRFCHPRPEPVEEECLEFTGKIEALVYDHFGDFDGFVLELRHEGEHRFYSREAHIEALAREAWAERIVASVVVESEHCHRPLNLILRRSSTAPRIRDQE